MPPAKKRPCSICGEAGDGAHFGAEACRACAAFFRRSVALNKNYVCRASGNCVIQSNVRCMCRSCRYTKCLAVGMRKSAVQKNREVNEKSVMTTMESKFSYLMNTFPMEIDLAPENNGMYLLTKLNKNYEKMNTIRRVIHHRNGNNLFVNPKPRALHYKEANIIHTKEIKLVLDWLTNSYPEFEALPIDQKKLLYKNFFLPFMILESGYHCCFNDNTDLIILPSGDYIDTTRPETFYSAEKEHILITSEDAIRIFKPSFDIYRKNVLEPMRSQKVDNFEFFTLCSLVLWDHGLEDQSDFCVDVSRSMRERILKEILYYYRNVRLMEDPSMRLANLLILLPAVQRSVRRFQEDVEITHVFNVCSLEENFYNLINGRISDNLFPSQEGMTMKTKVEWTFQQTIKLKITYPPLCFLRALRT
ncbi:unnamed protein product [Caenorhabditis bovis]|uniref:Uncharacterized protein n=1 Tax=Caenorhabditis bovis TaxID=2654633 RepID=A0A8S1ENL9_9PELO|nr:unnamed protein product [Caenorhabditis bovis]